MEYVILVDERDVEKEIMEKMEAHRRGALHRAFSVCLFDVQRRWLLQKRAATKYHSPNLWANSCCGHPRPGEHVTDAAIRRLQEELGVVAQLTFCTSFVYKTEVGQGLIEHEFDHIFVGTLEGNAHLNPEEVSAIRWASTEEICASLDTPSFAPWFPFVFGAVKA